MLIGIKTSKDGLNYSLDLEDASNDEICRAIAHLEVIKLDLLDSLDYDYEVRDNE